MYEKFVKKLYEAETVAIFMHVNPDGDAVGSSLAFYLFLKKLGKQPYVFLEEGNTIRDNLNFLPSIDVINSAELKHYDLSVALDCGAASRIGKSCFKKFLCADDFACIDHHSESTPFVDDYILEPKAAATAQILYKVFKEIDEKCIDIDVATCLFTAIAADSGSLTFSSTTQETFAVAAELSAYNVDAYSINRALYKDTKKSVYELSNRVLSRTEFYYDDTFALISFRNEDFLETGTTQADTEGIINRVIDIIGVKIAVSVAEAGENTYKIGIRSKDGADASALAAVFGGGGHFNASGCRIYDSFDNTVVKILNAAADVLEVYKK